MGLQYDLNLSVCCLVMDGVKSRKTRDLLRPWVVHLSQPCELDAFKKSFHVDGFFEFLIHNPRLPSINLP